MPSSMGAGGGGSPSPVELRGLWQALWTPHCGSSNCSRSSWRSSSNSNCKKQLLFAELETT